MTERPSLAVGLMSGTSLDGMELVFKGGQTGSVGFFENVRRGKP